MIAQVAGTAAATTLGAAVGGAAGATAAFNEDANNRLLHPAEIKWIANNRKAFANKLSQELGRPVSDLEAMQWLVCTATGAMSLVKCPGRSPCRSYRSGPQLSAGLV